MTPLTPLTPDQNVLLRWGFAHLTETVVVTWGIMAVLVVLALGLTRSMVRRAEAAAPPTRAQLALELLVATGLAQIREAVRDDPRPYLPFIGTLFIFIAGSSLAGVVPGVTPPTAAPSTAVALALGVFVAVPAFGIAREGVGGWLRHYLQPTPFMLPFHLVSEISRTLALAVRLFGNVMSGTLMVAILIGVVPFFVPVVLQAFGLLIGLIQAYVFSVLALIYIASGTQVRRTRSRPTANL